MEEEGYPAKRDTTEVYPLETKDHSDAEDEDISKMPASNIPAKNMSY